MSIASRQKWEERLRKGIRRRALLIVRDPSVPQDLRILCPLKDEGLYCQWVAGHYGGCCGGRHGHQRRLA